LCGYNRITKTGKSGKKGSLFLIPLEAEKFKTEGNKIS
jgi:hypothetical protein